MSEREQPDEETRRIAYKNAPAWAIEAGWENPDDKPRTAEDAWVEEKLRIEQP